jgi:alpha-glucosidase (family GH31 glycosyl hydrolase)
LSTTYLPKGEWFDFYRGYKLVSRNGESYNIQNMRNETTLHIRAGSVIFKQDCNKNAVDSKNTFVDIIIALEESTNYTASGQLYYDDETKKGKNII